MRVDEPCGVRRSGGDSPGCGVGARLVPELSVTPLEPALRLVSSPAPIDWSNPPVRLVVLSVLGVAAAYVAWHLNRGWVPLDEGSLAHAAQRVLQGELPQRDFDDVYTGGLAYLNAATFRLLGTTLWSMRLGLFAAFLLWVPTVFYVASRFARPVLAAGITLLAVAWSLPNYPAPMPSWYNLFLATAGVAALLRHLEDPRARWLVAAGVAGGLSFLVKVIGLYYVAGVLLFLVFLAHERARTSTAAPQQRGRGYAAFVTVGLLLFVGALASVVRGRLTASDLIQFVLPGAALAALLARNEWAIPAGASRVRFRALAALVGPFLLGVLLPVALYLIPYARSGALGDFVSGVFLLPAKRLGHASFAASTGPMVALIPAAAVAFVAAWPALRGPRASLDRRALALIAFALVAILFASGGVAIVYRAVLFSFRGLLPVMAFAGAALLPRDRDVGPDATRRRARLVLLLGVTSVCTLVQFPFTVAIYFCYVAPLVALSAVAFCAYLDRPVPRALPALAVAFCTAFAVLRLNPSPLNDMDTSFERYPEVRPMRLDRAGLLVPLWQAGQYEATVDVVRQHARGEYIWASPDVPQLYFLSGYRNPTRSLFEFFDDTTGRSARVLRALEQHDVNLVVLNVSPQFSPRIPLAFYRELARRYPNSAFVEPYLIKWRDEPPARVQ